MSRGIPTLLIALVAAGLGWFAALRLAPESAPTGEPEAAEGENPVVCPAKSHRISMPWPAFGAASQAATQRRMASLRFRQIGQAGRGLPIQD